MKLKSLVLAGVLLRLAWCSSAAFAQTIYFDESNADRLLLGNATYEIALLKSNGGLIYLQDKVAGVNVTSGSLGNALWQAVFSDATILGGNDFASAGTDTFSYDWQSATSTLLLNYAPSAAKLAVVVSLALSEDAFFDLQLTFTNQSGKTLVKMKFPQRLKIKGADIDEALFPDKPGTILEPDFFSSILPSLGEYLMPHPPAVADYLAVEALSGNLSLYSIWTPGPIRQTELGFEQGTGDTVLLVHDFDMWEIDGATWTSPAVRIRISQDFVATALSYRLDNALDTFDSVQDKLGVKYEAVLQSPMLHLDPTWVGKGFAQWPDMFSQLPTPSILMLSNFWTGDFHGHHPDYVPPDAQYGTTAELQAAVAAAHDLGMLVMPMTLPVWWHESSSTILNLPVPLTDVAILDVSGNPDYFFWELAGRVDWGYNISPRAPYALQRLDEFIREMKDTLDFDLIYEDVLGARDYEPDFSPHAAGVFDTEGWIEHTRTYSDRLLMTETGYDHLAETEVGFLGGGWIPDWQDSPVFFSRPFPLSGLLMHDKVLFYHYWAFPNTTRGSLSWNLLFGYMLNFPLQTIASGAYKPIGDPWQDVNEYFQKYVVSRYADERLINFTELSGGDVLQCDYETISVIANRNVFLPQMVGEHTLPAEGVLVTSAAGDLVAGTFSAFNGDPLSAGEHFLIEQRGAQDIIVHQPLGTDTPLTLNFLSNWSQTDPIWLLAYDAEDGLIDVISPTLSASGITFIYQQNRQGQHVTYYKVINSSAPPQPEWTAFFNDYDSEVMLLGNRDYIEINLGKQNGALNYVLDKTTGDTLINGVQWWRLWLASFPEAPNPNVGPGTMIDYWPGGPNDFRHSWDAQNRTLTLSYVPDPIIFTEWLGAEVTFVMADGPYFDVQITLFNHWGYAMEGVSFPNNLLLDMAEGAEALLPVSYPGIRLKTSFFDQMLSTEGTYPGDFHADFSAFRTQDRIISMYGLHHDEPVRMVQLGIMYEDNPQQNSNVFIKRSYPVWVENGESWTSPKLRIRFDGSYEDGLNGCRLDNKLDTFASLETKLGSRYATTLRSPIFYASFGESLSVPFSQVPTFTEQLPSPSLIMLSNYYTGGFHGHHPDYLPPDPQWGTTADLVQMVSDIKAQGKLVMPFTLPTWWHEQSPSVSGLTTPGLDDIAQIGHDGQPVFHEWEGDGGYFVSPHHPFVQTRLAQMMDEMKGTVGGDLLYEDVIAARASNYDFNPAAPSPMDYNQGWLEHTQLYKDSLLIVERGYDRMAETAVGFMGTSYFNPDEEESELNFSFGEDTWEHYPTAPALYHDKVLTYQFWPRSVLDNHILSWNLAFGCMLNFWPDAGVPERHPASPWIQVLADFQQHVISRIAGKRLTDYEEVTTGATRSTFEDISVTRNNRSSPFQDGMHTIATAGAAVNSASGDLVAGIFTAFNGASLEAGEHHLVVHTNVDSIVVRHPLGENTPLRIARPNDWENEAGVRVSAVLTAGAGHDVSSTVTPDYITFDLNKTVLGAAPLYYKLTYDGTIDAVVGDLQLPEVHGLSQNYPNPFNPTTHIEYQVAAKGQAAVSLIIFDVLGQTVATLVNEDKKPGYYRVVWDGRTSAGSRVASGVYFYELKIGEFVAVRKLIMLR